MSQHVGSDRLKSCKNSGDLLQDMGNRQLGVGGKVLGKKQFKRERLSSTITVKNTLKPL